MQNLAGVPATKELIEHILIADEVAKLMDELEGMRTAEVGRIRETVLHDLRTGSLMAACRGPEGFSPPLAAAVWHGTLAEDWLVTGQREGEEIFVGLPKALAHGVAGKSEGRLPDVRIMKRNVLTTTMERADKAKNHLPLDGYNVILANPPFSGRLDKDRIVDDVKIGTTTATEILFLKYMMDNLAKNGRCGVIVPEGILFGSTGSHKELRRMLIENNRVEAVLSLPGGVFQPYSGVKTSVLIFTSGKDAQERSTERVMFLHADQDGFKLDANHDTPVDDDDLPGLIAAFNSRDEKWQDWQTRNPAKPWTEKWWFADTDTIRAEGFNLSASRYRPDAAEAVEHADPRDLLRELRDETAAILEEIDALAGQLAEVRR
jgi:type I restriction-modification system DNA methylase subunit